MFDLRNIKPKSKKIYTFVGGARIIRKWTQFVFIVLSFCTIERKRERQRKKKDALRKYMIIQINVG